MSLAYYEALPHTVEAWRVTNDQDDLDALMTWCHGWRSAGGIAVPHPQGVLYASLDDVVVYVDTGVFLVVPGHVFAEWFNPWSAIPLDVETGEPAL